MLLKSKFFPPSVESNYHLPHGLQEHFSQINDFKITALLGSPGYGKSTAMAYWIAQRGACSDQTRSSGKTAWLSLDHDDNDTRRFWQYLSGALLHGQIYSDVAFHERLFSEPDRPIKSLITGLLNQLDQHAEAEQSTLLVLDDFDVITRDEVLESFSFFLDYLPAHLRVVLISRHRPALHVARRRMADEYREMLPELFALNQRETIDLFNRLSRVEPAVPMESELGQLIFELTQGWPVGIKLLQISCRDQQTSLDCDAVRATVRSSDLMSEYFLEEIVNRLPTALATFLYLTAHLPRLSVDLCNACLADNREGDMPVESDSRRYLDQLLAEGVFLEALDQHRTWYRYHGLFQQFLRSRAERYLVEKLPRLRISAATWFQAHHCVEEALDQVLLLGDWDWAAELIEREGLRFIHEARFESLKRLLLRLPGLTIEERPKLMIFFLRVWIYESTTHINPTSRYIQQVERCLKEAQAALDIGDHAFVAEYGINDLKDWYRIHGELRFIQSFWARLHGEARFAESISRASLQTAEREDLPQRSEAHFSLGMSLYLQGQLKEGAAAVAEALRYGQLESNYEIVGAAAVRLAWVYQWQGEFKSALQVYKDTRTWLESRKRCSDAFICWQNLMLVAFYRELNQMDKADECLQAVYQMMDDDRKLALFVPLVHARLEESRRAYSHAEQLLDEVEALYRPIAATIQGFPSLGAARARLSLLQGDPLAADEWLEQWALEVDKSGTSILKSHRYRYEEERITAARVMISRIDQPGTANDVKCETGRAAVALLEDIEEQARKGNRVTNRVTCRVLMAVTHLLLEGLVKGQRSTRALSVYLSALRMGGRTGYVRLFIEEFPLLQRRLLQRVKPDNAHYDYAQRLLALLEEAHQGVSLSQQASSSVELIEPLSRREMDVLTLMSQGLANKLIADQLFVGVGTVKTHVRNILGKLAVANRTQAVAKAREVGVL